jgi:hypothetical protein
MATSPIPTGESDVTNGDLANLKPSDNAEASMALDGLAALITAKAPPAELDPKAAVIPPAPTPEELAAKEAADAAAKAAATPPAPTPEEIAAKAAAEAAAPPPDNLDSFELPAHAKPKSAEAFGRLKQAARELTTALQKQLETERQAKTKLLADLEEARKAVPPVPPETAKELEDLRKFRLSKDVESDPEFAKFDATLQANVGVIYKKLEASGVCSAEHIAKIKELGGPDAIDWEPIMAKLALPTRRFIEATLVDNERLREQKSQALEAAQANAEGYTKQRTERDQQELSGAANKFLKDLTWTQDQEIPASATAEEKASLEQANQAARGARATLQQFMSDRSPSRFAELAVGTLIAHRLRSELVATQAKLAEATKGSAAQLAALTKERDQFKADLDKIKRAQLPRNRSDGVTPPKPPQNAMDVSGAEALDALAKQVLADANEE